MERRFVISRSFVDERPSNDSIRAPFRSASWPPSAREDCQVLSSPSLTSLKSESTHAGREVSQSSDMLWTSQSRSSSSLTSDLRQGNVHAFSGTGPRTTLGRIPDLTPSIASAPTRRTKKRCKTCNNHICVNGRQCVTQGCPYCHAGCPEECDKQCRKCFRNRCPTKWWQSGGDPNVGVCSCDREHRELLCHAISTDHCKSGSNDETRRISQELQYENSENMKRFLHFNNMVNSWNQLPANIAEENLRTNVSGNFRNIFKEMNQNRTLGPSSERGLFLADTIYVRLANAASGENESVVHSIMTDFGVNIWPHIAPYLNLHRNRVLIISLETETMENCNRHFALFERALRSTDADPRVKLRMFDAVSDVDLSWASVLWVLGHSENGSELNCIRRKFQLGHASKSIDFAFLGVCKSASIGMVLADEGTPTMCIPGLAEPGQVYDFAERVLNHLLLGPVAENGSQTALLAQITAAFSQGGGSKRNVFASSLYYRCCCRACTHTSSEMCLFLPSCSGQLLSMIRRWPITWMFATAAILILVLVVFWIEACHHLQCFHDPTHHHPNNWYGDYRPCGAIESISLPEAGGKVRILAVDMACHDRRPKGKLRRIDVHSGSIVRPSYAVVSHTAFFNISETVNFWVDKGIGPHFVITRDGYLVKLVHVYQNAFFVKGCFERHDDEPNCSRLEANAHGIGIMLEGDGCVTSFTEIQYATLCWIVKDLRRQGYHVNDERIMPLTEPDYFHGREVAPCHHFDWMKVKYHFEGVTIPRSWNGSKDIAQKQNWSNAIDVEYLNKVRIYGKREVIDFRPKWRGFYGEAPMSDCIAFGTSC